LAVTIDPREHGNDVLLPEALAANAVTPRWFLTFYSRNSGKPPNLVGVWSAGDEKCRIETFHGSRPDISRIRDRAPTRSCMAERRKGIFSGRNGSVMGH
jgi:hypothetical protein